jgi:hypothetical protein
MEYKGNVPRHIYLVEFNDIIAVTVVMYHIQITYDRTISITTQRKFQCYLHLSPKTIMTAHIVAFMRRIASHAFSLRDIP